MHKFFAKKIIGFIITHIHDNYIKFEVFLYIFGRSGPLCDADSDANAELLHQLLLLFDLPDIFASALFASAQVFLTPGLT